jgi:two-component system, sensor histidine kinase and response regulator
MARDLIKFLLVDDAEENLVALEALLRREGLECLKARSGSEALELLLVHEVALAFLDVQMPDMDGFELAELMRGAARTKHVPIIFVTAGARNPQRIFKGYETGAVDFLFKPIEPMVLKGKADVFFELFRQRKELANALRLNEMFVGILGHDLRNPLGAIILGAQLLERQLSDDKQLRTLERITTAGQRMTDMIEQLLDLTRARLAGGVGFVRARRRVDMTDLVQRTVEELRGAHPGKEISVEASGDGSTRGDGDRLLQLLSNLIANAIYHGTAGGGVRVRVQGLPSELTVQVHNQGVIPPDLLPTIFDPFRSGHPSTKSRGLGLGLFISQQIAVAHGGCIDVASNAALGTVFTARIPRVAVGPRPLGLGGKPLQVLLVEDDPELRNSLEEAFDDESYAVAIAASAQEALDRVIRDGLRPDVIILDLVSSVIDSVRVVQSLAADAATARIPVIVSTSTPGRAPAGVIVVPKPLEVDRVLSAVAALWRAEPG